MKHIIDMFDSTDVQVAYILGGTMVDRMTKAFNETDPDDNHYTYSIANGKKTFFTVYLAKSSSDDLGLCPTCFFPRPECDGAMGWDVVSYQTEAKMFEEVKLPVQYLQK